MKSTIMEQDRYKRQLAKTAALMVIGFTLIFLVNYIIDPYNVNCKFNVCRNKKGEFIRERVSKFYRLNDAAPNTILIGASRVEFLNAVDLAKYTNDRVYNLALSGATIAEQLVLLKYSIDNFDINNVIIGISFNGFISVDGKSVTYRETFPLGLFEKKINSYLRIFMENYLSVAALKFSCKTLFAEKSEQFQYLDKTGSRTLDFQNYLIAKGDSRSRIKRTLKSFEEDVYSKKIELCEQNIQMFREMIRICKSHDIKYKVYIPPIHFLHHKMICCHHRDKLDTWKHEIARITDYFDFSGENDITTDDRNYIESSHSKQQTGKLIFAKIYNDRMVDIPQNFGKLISMKNHFNKEKR